MSLSLREQLLKAGLVTEKQAKQAERARSRRRHPRPQTRKRAPRPRRPGPARAANAPVMTERRTASASCGRNSAWTIIQRPNASSGPPNIEMHPEGPTVLDWFTCVTPRKERRPPAFYFPSAPGWPAAGRTGVRLVLQLASWLTAPTPR